MDERVSRPDLAPVVVERIKAAVDMGDVMQIQSIAEELKTGSEATIPFYDRILRLAADFDLDGINTLLRDLGY